MNKNAANLISDSKCYGCGICAGICPKKALGMEINKRGFYRPVENQDTCVECNSNIDKGESYKRVFSVVDGSGETYKFCLFCEEIRKKYWDELYECAIGSMWDKIGYLEG